MVPRKRIAHYRQTTRTSRTSASSIPRHARTNASSSSGTVAGSNRTDRANVGGNYGDPINDFDFIYKFFSMPIFYDYIRWPWFFCTHLFIEDFFLFRGSLPIFYGSTGGIQGAFKNWKRELVFLPMGYDNYDRICDTIEIFLVFESVRNGFCLYLCTRYRITCIFVLTVLWNAWVRFFFIYNFFIH